MVVLMVVLNVEFTVQGTGVGAEAFETNGV